MKTKEQNYGERSARQILSFIIRNKKHLQDKDYQTALNLIQQKEAFTPNQISLIKNSLYEKVMKGAGFESCGAKHDFKKKIRY